MSTLIPSGVHCVNSPSNRTQITNSIAAVKLVFCTSDPRTEGETQANAAASAADIPMNDRGRGPAKIFPSGVTRPGPGSTHRTTARNRIRNIGVADRDLDVPLKLAAADGEEDPHKHGLGHFYHLFRRAEGSWRVR